MSVKWTPELIERLREVAATGCTSKKAAMALRVPWMSAKIYARRNGITFTAKQQGSTFDNCSTVPPDFEEYARAELRRQIELAKAEQETAPPYEGWRL